MKQAKFFAAVSEGNSSVLESMLPSMERADLQEALVRASAQGHLDVVERLLHHRSLRGCDPSRAFIQAIRHQQQHIIERLLQIPDFNPAFQKSQALREAAELGHIAILNRLLECPTIDVTAGQQQALRGACGAGHQHIVARLLELPQVDVRARNYEAVCVAASRGYLAIVQRLIQAARNPSTAANNALVSAATLGQQEVVEWLLAWPGIVDSPQYITALTQASTRNQIEVLNLLLDAPGFQMPSDIYSFLAPIFLHCCRSTIARWSTFPPLDLTDLLLDSHVIPFDLPDLCEAVVQMPRFDADRFLAHNHYVLPGYVTDQLLKRAVIQRQSMVYALGLSEETCPQFLFSLVVGCLWRKQEMEWCMEDIKQFRWHLNRLKQLHLNCVVPSDS